MRFPSAGSPVSGHCFRTEADGRIALTRDWPRLLREATAGDRLAVQTRHTAARLVGLLDDCEITTGAAGAAGLLRDRRNSLHCCFSRWARGWGWLRPCACCGSPGRIEVHQADGLDFLHLTPLPHSIPLAWSERLAAVTARALEMAAPTVARRESGFTRPRLARVDARFPFHREGFATLLSAFGDEGLPVRFTLRTAEIAHRCDFTPRQVWIHDATLTAGEAGFCAQLACPAACEFAVTADADGPALHIIDARQAVLLTISAAAHPLGAATWRGALRAAFAGLAPFP
jgi:hypothetical protein